MTEPEHIESEPASPPPAANSGGQQPVTEPPPTNVADTGQPIYGAGKLSETWDRNLCMLLHAAGGIFWFMPPLIVWLVKRHESPAIDAHGKEAVNFQLTAFMVAVICGFVSCGIGVFIPWFFSIVLAVVGAAKASNGQVFRYPIPFRFIK